MKKILFTLLTLFLCLSSRAIKPERIYYANPADYGLEYTSKKLVTKDKAEIMTWHMPHRKGVPAKNISIIISNPDNQNMSTWFIIAVNFVGRGYDVYMYDYRGFGESSDFETKSSMLYYNEFIEDLNTVVKFAKEDAPKNKVCLLGMQMGSIISMNYLAKNKDAVDFYIAENHIFSPQTYVKEALKRGQVSQLPENAFDYSESYKDLKKPMLLFHTNDDFASTAEQLETLKNDVKNLTIHDCQTAVMNCFYNSPLTYLKTVNIFLTGKEE